MDGRFITFEGPEGCGKSTQIRLLAQRIEAQGRTVQMTREPGGTATGELIRNLLQHDNLADSISKHAELLLFTASRAQLMAHVILPALARGEWVLCDRFIDSTMAYQGFGRGMDIETLDRINAFAIYGRKPDLTLLLDLDVKTGFQRLTQRYSNGAGKRDRFELEDVAFHQRVYDGYHQLAAREPQRFRIIDATGSVETVAEAVARAVTEVLG